MAKVKSEAMECRIVGRLGREPEAATTLGGVAVCRLVVVKRAAGPASSPARVGLYLKGELAKRCGAKLHEGDLVEALGELGNRRGKARPRYPEVLVEDAPDNVKLYERAGVAA
jgi:single-stranded DNA-binding protein